MMIRHCVLSVLIFTVLFPAKALAGDTDAVKQYITSGKYFESILKHKVGKDDALRPVSNCSERNTAPQKCLTYDLFEENAPDKIKHYVVAECGDTFVRELSLWATRNDKLHLEAYSCKRDGYTQNDVNSRLETLRSKYIIETNPDINPTIDIERITKMIAEQANN